MPCMASITGHSILALSLFCFLFSPALAAPLLNPEQKLRTRQDSTTAYLPGINFAYAQQECDANQLVHLRRAFTEVRDLAYATNPLSPAAGDDPPFVQFFGIGYIGVYGRYFWKVFENLRKAGDFPSQGVGPGEANQVSVHCADIGNHCTGRTAAYVGNGYSTGSPGTIMVLCPFFWDRNLPHLSDRAVGQPTTALATLSTQESVILHELMHAEIAGFQEPIIDIQTELPNEQDLVYCDQWGECYYTHNVFVYGVTRCGKLAAQKSPQTKTLKNADNYAWYATAKYFSTHWGINVNQIEGFVEGSTDPEPPAYAVPDIWYGADETGDVEWTSG